MCELAVKQYSETTGSLHGGLEARQLLKKCTLGSSWKKHLEIDRTACPDQNTDRFIVTGD